MRWVRIRAKSAFLRLACWVFAATLEELRREEPPGRTTW